MFNYKGVLIDALHFLRELPSSTFTFGDLMLDLSLYMLYGTTYFCVVDLNQKLGPSGAKLCRPGSKRTHEEGKDEVIDLDALERPKYSDAFKMDHRFQDLMFLDIMSPSGEWVVVERPALEVMKTLPPGFYKKAYGT